MRRSATRPAGVWYVKALWGVELPPQRVCPGHVSPSEAVAHAFFGRDPGFAVWYASRGSGNKLALAVLGLTKSITWTSTPPSSVGR